jgi:SPX domain protein involved in polyphosphate accumulation
MKFAEHLGAHITPEWRKQYIQYEVKKKKTVLKGILLKLVYIFSTRDEGCFFSI